jgi:quercetin dioxygenase-like cupin family protein
MEMTEATRRGLVQLLAMAPLFALVRPREAVAQTGTPVPVRVDTKGLVAKIKFESAVEGHLTELNGKYKLRVTELTLEPGGHVGEHNHVGPGIRMVTFGEMTYVLPDKTLIYGPSDFFFESGDVNHTVYNRSDKPNQHLLFEILPADLKGPSIMPVKKKP